MQSLWIRKNQEEQLDSILKQEAVDVDVYIRDDGSEEKFINVLKKINNDK